MTTKIKPPIPKEIDIQNAILAWLSWQKGCMAWRNKSTGVYDSTKKIFLKDRSPFVIKGVPDILGIWKSCPLAIEVKRPNGKPSPEQKAFIERFRANGGIAFIAHSVEEVKAYLETQKELGESKLG